VIALRFRIGEGEVLGAEPIAVELR